MKNKEGLHVAKWKCPIGSNCLVSDKITKEGFCVGYMYREESEVKGYDSGWRFLAGNEDEEYMNNPNNFHMLSMDMVCNYDKSIIPFIYSKIGSAFVRTENHKFEKEGNLQKAFVTMQS